MKTDIDKTGRGFVNVRNVVPESKALASEVEAVVAGSVFVRIITENQNNPDALYKAVRAKAEELTSI